MTYKVILFDVDDTLFDFSMCEKSAFDQAFLDMEVTDALQLYHQSYREISSRLWRELEEGNWSVGELGIERFRRLFLKHELKLDAEPFNQTYLSCLAKEAHLVEGAVEACQHLSQYRLAVITNGFKDVQLSRIQRSPLQNMFECIITSEEAGAQKPDASIFDYVFKKLRLSNDDKKEVLILGDSLTSDMKGGHDYGIDTCWFNPSRKENNTGIEPTYEINKLAEVLEVVT
ncbi:YjjG family noncanonical pyrimidine nucleotidase [Alteribacillus iranensis]|uniref:2-haloacid dehalogenase n=1 Tax=Alteribacillus iranensis TaxID=930128 RepID=A0A1I2D1E9_9BACI|nr:YjjG family noncanonical pyrimidine nucleotidase [Alteribacillus iranensis]SFE74348.1 2-haloacid dehalogenase [Alteribacillus iranensis]